MSNQYTIPPSFYLVCNYLFIYRDCYCVSYQPIFPHDPFYRLFLFSLFVTHWHTSKLSLFLSHTDAQEKPETLTITADNIASQYKNKRFLERSWQWQVVSSRLPRCCPESRPSISTTDKKFKQSKHLLMAFARSGDDPQGLWVRNGTDEGLKGCTGAGCRVALHY